MTSSKNHGSVRKHLDKTQSPPGLVGFGLLLVAMFPVVGHLYVPVRLYFLGSPREVTVVSCDEKTTASPQVGVQTFFRVRVAGYEQEFSVAYVWKCGLDPGDTVTLWFSDKLNRGVILPEGRSILHVFYHYGSGVGGIVLFTGFWFLLLLASVVRLGVFALNVKDVVRERYRKAFCQRRTGIEYCTVLSEFVTDCAFLVMSLCFVVLVLFGVISGLLYFESAPLPIIGGMLCVAGFAAFSPLPERIIQFVWRLRAEEIWRRLLRIVRNSVATVCFMFVSWKILSFLVREDLRSYEGLMDVLQAFVFSLL